LNYSNDQVGLLHRVWADVKRASVAILRPRCELARQVIPDSVAREGKNLKIAFGPEEIELHGAA
jgi:hypothetical protein